MHAGRGARHSSTRGPRDRGDRGHDVAATIDCIVNTRWIPAPAGTGCKR
jgi:hypothetical protein